MTLAIIFLYLATVFAIGTLSHRLLRGTGEDFFLASRTIGPFVLLMSLFGTHMTAFSLLGASGEAYHHGVGVFALMASSSALVVPLAFFFLAPRVWRLGERHGYLTQVEFFRDRWQSNGLGLLLFLVMVALLVPYLLIGIKGGGITLAQITGGDLPEWVGSVLMCLVVLGYVAIGGLRGTAWVNTFQTLVFMALGATTFFLITHKLGGLGAAMEKVGQAAPDLLARSGHVAPLQLFTYLAIPLSVAMFPHIFMHWLTAKNEASFRLPIVAYPICVAIVWVPSVVLGILGNLDFPGLAGPQANSVLVMMIAKYAPGAMAGLLAAGVFAAVMSSLDSQVLSLSTMFTRDIVNHYGFSDRLGDRQSVVIGRIFVAAIFAITLALALTVDRSLFKLGIWCFTGFAALTPLIVAALYWRRSTRTGAFSAILVTASLWIYFFGKGWDQPGYTLFDRGIMPVAVILVASSLAMVVGSLLSSPPDEEHVARFFRVGEYGDKSLAKRIERGHQGMVSPVKIAYIAAGAGGMYCGSCIHDNTTAAALQKLGHDVALLPTYTPMRTDEASVSTKRVFYGAVGVYLEQKSGFFRKRHRAIDWLLNRPSLLNLAAKFSGSTDARELGELALSVLRGEQGSAQKELDELVSWLREDFKPDLVHITNSMFLGLVRRFKQELGVPVVVAVQGEDLFLDELPPEFRDQAVAEMRARADETDAFLAPNRFYADKMRALLDVPESKMHVVPLGLKLAGHSEPVAAYRETESENAPAIGYLARICPEKGLHLLVDAFCQLAREPGRENLRLRVAGYLGPKDRSYYREVEQRVVAAGLIERYDFLGEVDRESKISFLRSVDLLSVPTVYEEAKGLFVLEALANGVPVVQPRHGSFPELIEATGGGLLVEPSSQQALCDGLAALLDDPDRRQSLGASGREAVFERFGADQMAEATLTFYQIAMRAAGESPQRGGQVSGSARPN